MLGGEYRHGLDPKNRVFIPAKLREELGETFIVVKDLREKCLKIYSQAEWDKYIAPIKNQERRLVEKVLRFLNSFHGTGHARFPRTYRAPQGSCPVR